VPVWLAGHGSGDGMLRAAPGIAAVLTGLGMALARPARHLVRTIALSMTGACAGLIAFTVAPVLAVGIAALGLAFAAVSVCQILVAAARSAASTRLRKAGWPASRPREWPSQPPAWAPALSLSR
jgi:hypothetical protein